MPTPQSAEFGVIGTAVMGSNLALNIADHDFKVTVWNLEQEIMNQVVADSEGMLSGNGTLEEFISTLGRPRKIIMMIEAGPPVDNVLTKLRVLLDKGDIIIDGGNSWFKDTQRREEDLRKNNIRFFGMGVSGGEEGARHGPALMPGGDVSAYQEFRIMVEAIAAKTDSGACVTHCGEGGAGHFVKMVHNGIEYADMQFIAEAYDLLRRLAGFTPPELSDTFAKWNQGPLESFLIEITSKVFSVPGSNGGFLIDQVLDKAGQKGTGRWAVNVALDLGVPTPSITAAVESRMLSSMKSEREQASQLLLGPTLRTLTGSAKASFVEAVHDALYAARIAAYAQGMALIQAGAKKYTWSTDLKEIARIWKGGCIIRARFLNDIMRAYDECAELPNLLLDRQISGMVADRQGAWRKVVSMASNAGVPVPGMSATLAYYDSYRTANLPQNLTQAQRDAFGAHTYRRAEEPDGHPVHSEWLR